LKNKAILEYRFIEDEEEEEDDDCEFNPYPLDNYFGIIVQLVLYSFVYDESAKKGINRRKYVYV
jgi:hypothetical protein